MTARKRGFDSGMYKIHNLMGENLMGIINDRAADVGTRANYDLLRQDVLLEIGTRTLTLSPEEALRLAREMTRAADIVLEAREMERLQAQRTALITEIDRRIT